MYRSAATGLAKRRQAGVPASDSLLARALSKANRTSIHYYVNYVTLPKYLGALVLALRPSPVSLRLFVKEREREREREREKRF